MTQTLEPSKKYRHELTPPLYSAADVNPANRPRIHFDRGIAFAIKEIAQGRAPTQTSKWEHRVGFAGELASSAYFGVSANWTITPEYIGDDGYDFRYKGERIEVKTTTSKKEDDWQLAIPIDKVERADQFILAQCSEPNELVQLIGFIDRFHLLSFGHQFDGKVRVELRHLFPLEPLELFPEQIRDSQRIRPADSRRDYTDESVG